MNSDEYGQHFIPQFGNASGAFICMGYLQMALHVHTLIINLGFVEFDMTLKFKVYETILLEFKSFSTMT